VLALSWRIVAVQEDALLGENQLCASALRLELDSRCGNGNPRLAHIQSIGVNDALVRHNVLVPGIEGKYRSAQ
jgi:hypothetical protein